VREPIIYSDLEVGKEYVVINGPIIERWRCTELATYDDGSPWFAGFEPIGCNSAYLEKLYEQYGKSPIGLRPYEMAGEDRYPIYRPEVLDERSN
jgi:hypothetical protein